MKITSSVFKHNERIPEKYTCDAENINPPLEFHEVPDNAVCLVLIMDDPMAPMGTWTHWTMWNIAPTIRGLSPKGIVSLRATKRSEAIPVFKRKL